MIDRVFFSGFWFGLTIAGILFCIYNYFFTDQAPVYIIVGLVLTAVAYLEYSSYTQFVNDLRIALQRKSTEGNQDE